jgi:hypothetical protein
VLPKANKRNRTHPDYARRSPKRKKVKTKECDGSQAAPLHIEDDERVVPAGSITNLLANQADKMYGVAGPIPDEPDVSKETVNNLNVFHLRTAGSMLQATVVRAYLNTLLADTNMNYWGKGVRLMCKKKFEHVQQYGWDKYVEVFSRHNKYFKATDWEKDLFFVVPIFTGPPDGEHFTA